TAWCRPCRRHARRATSRVASDEGIRQPTHGRFPAPRFLLRCGPCRRGNPRPQQSFRGEDMTRIFHRPLAAAIATALAFTLLAPLAYAGPQQDKPMTPRERLAKERAMRGETAKQAEQKPAKYPDATRESPEAAASGKTLKQLQSLQEL